MTITLLYFASARTAMGVSTEELDLPRGTLLFSLPSLLLERLQDGKLGTTAMSTNSKGRKEELEQVFSRSAWSLNEEIVDLQEEEEQGTSTTLKERDVVAVLPPVSGG